MWGSVSWSTSCKYGFRHVRIHLIRPRCQVLGRSEIRPLYENTATNPLPRSNGCNNRLLHDPNWCSKLDVRQRPKHLHTTSNQRVHMPARSCALQWKYPMGCRRTRRILRSQRDIPHPRLLLPYWCHSSNNSLAIRTQPQGQHNPQDQPPRPIRLTIMDSSCHWSQLLRLGTRMLHIQLCDSTEGISLVGEIHHDAKCSAGFWTRLWSCCGVLWIRFSGIDGWI